VLHSLLSATLESLIYLVYPSMASFDYRYLSKIDPEFAVVLAKFPHMNDIHNVQVLREQRANHPLPLLEDNHKGVTETDSKFFASDGYEVPIRIYHPPSIPEGGSPLMVFFHGGGFCLGGLNWNQVLIRDACYTFGLVVMHIDYRLAPENPYPVGLNDAWEGVQWAYKNAETLKATLTRGFIVGGISAGANLAAVISHRALESDIKLTGVFLSVPTVCSAEFIPEKYKESFFSFEQNINAPGLSWDDIKFYIDTYNPDHSAPDFSPLLWPTGHNGLPPTYIQIAGLDPLRDEAFIYDCEMKAAGVKTKVDVYPGMPHAFWLLAPQTSQSKKWRKDCVEGIRWMLG
jgi:acetyl esterase/lipase